MIETQELQKREQSRKSDLTHHAGLVSGETIVL